MKRLLVVMLVAAFAFAGSLSAFAAGPEVIKFPAKMGEVTFPHHHHQETLRSCKPCHEKAPGKIEGFGKDWAHKTCKGCHQEKGVPTTCKTCHKK